MVPLLAQQPPVRKVLRPPRKNDVFISYSRKDKAFVETLDAALRAGNRDPWIDWDDIQTGEDWWQSICRGIEAADTFVFVISPDSVASEVCRREIDHAAQCHKRCLPMVRREGFSMDAVHPWIAQHNWLFCRETDAIDAAFLALFKAIDTDLAYVRAHTRLLVRSLEWFHQNRDRSYLLRGTDLEEAQQWLTQGINVKPRPTEGQVAYINASLGAETQLLKFRQNARWVVVLTTVLANLMFVTGGLFWIYARMIRIAQAEITQTMEATLNGAIRGIDGDEFAELITVESAPGQAEPLDNALYQRHQTWLKTIHQVTPSALPISYVRGNDPREVLIIGDIYRAIQPDYAYQFRQPYRLEHQQALQLLDGFDGVSLDLDIYQDQDGQSWVAIYGPIQNSAGESVGALMLEYDAAYLTDLEGAIAREMAIVCTVAATWLLVSSGLVLRVIQPSHEFLGIRKRIRKTVAIMPRLSG
ncbi:MAG: toll/interleukin-1 receptor domain-containing protein [Cyanobacteria bacterium]|nr:toll/interleukin-1 receptor domain-containing protein [Cyanobacteriota bacterium]MDA0865027.1 toll/interleukin-1 receptor domain-containing protein [Cyanobacteriota bacterium]